MGLSLFDRLNPATPAGTASASPAPAPIELAPGLNPTDKTLPAKPATDTTASPATASAAQEAERALPPPQACSNLLLHPSAAPAPASAIGPPRHRRPLQQPPAGPPRPPACAAVQQSARQAYTCSRSSRSTGGQTDSGSGATRSAGVQQARRAGFSPAAQPPRPSRPAASWSNALHDDIVRRQEALKRQRAWNKPHPGTVARPQAAHNHIGNMVICHLSPDDGGFAPTASATSPRLFAILSLIRRQAAPKLHTELDDDGLRHRHLHFFVANHRRREA